MRKFLIVPILIVIIGLFVSANPSGKHRRVFERPIQVEEWMTQPFAESIEEPLEVEEWMTKPFITK